MKKGEVIKALEEYFGTNGSNRKFFDASQIPRVCENIDRIEKHFDQMVNDHEQRIRKVEGKQMWILGGAGAFGAAISWIVSWVRGH